MHIENPVHLPHKIGMRNIKTAVTAAPPLPASASSSAWVTT